MKILTFSDVHVSKRHCQKLVEMSADADIVIGAGDFGSVRRGIIETIDWLREIDKPSILVPGNSESLEELAHACENWTQATVLHGNGVHVQGLDFYGIGGGIPVTPFGSWSYDFTEDEARDLLNDCPSHAILISHSPPKGILDVSSWGKSLGSYAVLECIKEKDPQLVVCGHIHESSGAQTTYENTTVINAGSNGIFHEL